MKILNTSTTINPKVTYNIYFKITILMSYLGFCQNPIVPNQGLNDPHIHIFNDKAYVYASHDKSPDNKTFVMENWWIWSSPDLVNWTKESILNPEDTYIAKPFNSCWATDVGFRNNKYYWYFSEKNEQTGVVIGDTPTGPWKDPLGKPLLESSLTPTHEYDMAIFEDKGSHYIIFGVWDYYIAKLNNDMISLAETPKKIIINNARGPYNLDGNNKEMPTDDKPTVHKYNGNYYLSWGCFYAMSDNLYGPYDYKDTVIKKESFAVGYDSPTWPTGFLQGRHGNFFEWHNQWYYTYCDISQTGNRYFRDAFISYVHYKENGEMAPIRIDGIGVGQYEASQLKIEAENFFKAKGFKKIEAEKNNFMVSTTENKSYLNFPNIKDAKNYTKIELNYKNPENGRFIITLRRDSIDGLVLSKYELKQTNNIDEVKKISFKNLDMKTSENLYIVVEALDGKSLELDAFSFKK